MTGFNEGTTPSSEDADADEGEAKAEAEVGANHAALVVLAEAAGVVREWIDAGGMPKVVTDDSLRAVLSALDLPCETAKQCRESQATLPTVEGNERLPALVTATCGVPGPLPLPAALAGMAGRIELEHGEVVECTLTVDKSGALCHPAIEQPGYHRLWIGEDSTILATAPARCFSVADALSNSTASGSRCWGLGVQLYSLRRPGDGGIGDFTSLNLLTCQAGALGASTVAISPVHAMFSGDGNRYSPYGPSSRLFLNALHIDPASVRGPAAMNAALASLDAETRNECERLEQASLIDWPLAGRIRLQLLRALFEQNFADVEADADVDADADADADDSYAEFSAFCKQGGEALEDHARFEMLHALQRQQGSGGDWRDWPASLQNPRNAEVAALAHAHRHEVDFYLFLQWQAANGLANAQASARQAGMAIGLIADLAIGADRGGSQAWSRQTQMINGLSVGAPPDTINTRGQNWGLGAFSPHAMKAKGFTAYIEMLRAVFAHCGGVRIDHVLGLARLWLVPDGRPSSEGAYLRYPLQDLLRLIALESHRHRAVVIGEDLGTVPAGFDTLLEDAALLGIRVLAFERDHAGFKPPAAWSNRAMATTTTHDLPTVAGWWSGQDIDWRAKLDLLAAYQSAEQAHAERADERQLLWQAFTTAGVTTDPMPTPSATTDVVDAAIAYVAATPAPLVILPIEDALGLEQQPNLPGTIDSHPNWRRRLLPAVTTIFDDPRVRARLALLDQPQPQRRREP